MSKTVLYVHVWQKWRLLFRLLPWAVLFVVAKVGVHLLHWEVWTFDSLTGTLFAAATFILAFMLSGTLRDYQASLYMPIELANVVEAIADANQLAAAAHPDYDPISLTTALSCLTQNLLAWLEQQAAITPVEQSLEQLNIHFAHVLAFGDIPVISRIQGEQAKLRLLIRRIRLIRDTDFLRPAYALLEIFLIGAVITLLLVSSNRFEQNLVVSTLLFIAFAYLLRMIRDLDNPFQYSDDSFLDADLSALREVKAHLAKQQKTVNESSGQHSAN
ncbi:MAG: hypothetical protein AAGD09_24515 [Cyanobacteria bacterium P01_F01_bin.56]